MNSTFKPGEIREAVFCFLYQLCIQKDSRSEQEERFLADRAYSEEERAFFLERCEGVSTKLEELDAAIEPLLKRWTLQRLPLVDLCILRLAVYEILYCKDLPHNVAISEAVRLAKIYSDDDARSYINGVLASFMRQREAAKSETENPQSGTAAALHSDETPGAASAEPLQDSGEGDETCSGI